MFDDFYMDVVCVAVDDIISSIYQWPIRKKRLCEFFSKQKESIAYSAL